MSSSKIIKNLSYWYFYIDDNTKSTSVNTSGLFWVFKKAISI